MKVSPLNFISEGVSAGNHFDLCFSGLAARTCSAYLLVDSTTHPTKSRKSEKVKGGLDFGQVDLIRVETRLLGKGLGPGGLGEVFTGTQRRGAVADDSSFTSSDPSLSPSLSSPL